MTKRLMKLKVEERVKLVESCLNNELSLSEAAREGNVSLPTIVRWLRLYENDGGTALLTAPKNRHYSVALKLSATIDYLNGKGSYEELAKTYKLRSSSQLKKWVQVYNTHGTFKSESGGSYMRKARETSTEERLTIVLDCLTQNKNYGAMALKYQVSYQQVRNWVKRYEEKGAAGLEDRRGRRIGTQPSRTPEEELRNRLAQSESKNRQLQMENDLLKKVRELERKWE
ncbi:hypothetical protein IGI37_002668 [Enterococcus sp. AZ194]|uniref:helix-turn-helix domain-containing protein n=1 Tax=Enterococcus sp. AZ194 TaxID=2774629 RepID=UPI003F25F97B